MERRGREEFFDNKGVNLLLIGHGHDDSGISGALARVLKFTKQKEGHGSVSE